MEGTDTDVEEWHSFFALNFTLIKPKFRLENVNESSMILVWSLMRNSEVTKPLLG